MPLLTLLGVQCCVFVLALPTDVTGQAFVDVAGCPVLLADASTHTCTRTPQGTVGSVCEQVLRVIDSLQLTAKYSVATPVNWKHGEKVMVTPNLSDEQATAKVSC